MADVNVPENPTEHHHCDNGAMTGTLCRHCGNKSLIYKTNDLAPNYDKLECSLCQTVHDKHGNPVPVPQTQESTAS